ncbi:hypothetical protein D9619_009429 [Psilocybe cf. subviscida]|uniref:F-box domain-containing protein n=1 Tax=Psilocybe cf. subviscida TaxID=2480587 RepID=A0A8H5BU17_9AGAR|nr:hypothetical protein D9619_009429 [Psilocybe cf. subviscida]
MIAFERKVLVGLKFQDMPGFTSSSPQAMHNAFQTDDVVREVFLHLRPPLDAPHRPSRHDRQTLYRAALVSRRFSSHAVDALWRAMYDFRPLLKLIPGIEYNTEIGVRILRPLCSEDFLAFDRYSRKIKAYHTHDDPFPISVPLIFEILHWLGRSHLLPSLSLLRIVNEITDNQYSLFCPSVRQLSIYLDQEEEALSLISHLVWATPSLMELEVEESPLVPEVLSLLGQMGSLTTLKLQNHLIVDPKSFNKNFPFAGRLRSLTVQSVSFLPSSVTQSQILMANNRGSVQFSALTHLVLSDPISVESITPIFSHSLFPCVEDLSLTLPDRVHGRNASIALFSAIFDCLFWFIEDDASSSATLLNAVLVCNKFSDPALDFMWYCMHCIKPLMKLIPSINHDAKVCGYSRNSRSAESFNASVRWVSPRPSSLDENRPFPFLSLTKLKISRPKFISPLTQLLEYDLIPNLKSLSLEGSNSTDINHYVAGITLFRVLGRKASELEDLEISSSIAWSYT